jgi:hypothetical protein
VSFNQKQHPAALDSSGNYQNIVSDLPEHLSGAQQQVDGTERQRAAVRRRPDGRASPR